MYRVKSNAVWHSLPGVVAAYQSIVAPDSLAARQNVAHGGARFGVYTAALGTAPTWGAATGWTFNGTTQYLDTKIIPPISRQWSYLLKFYGADISIDFQYVFGKSETGYAVTFASRQTATHSAVYNGASPLLVPGLISGATVGVAEGYYYQNGILVSNSVPAPSGNNATKSLYLGACNNLTFDYVSASTQQAILVASRVLTPAEMWLASRQMKYCDINPDWNAWARRRRYYYAPSAAAAAFNPAWARNANTVINQVHP